MRSEMPALSVAALLTALAMYAISLRASVDASGRLHWVAVLLWVGAGALLLLATRRGAPRGPWTRADVFALSACVVLSVLARTVFLDVYPYHVFGDAIRDNGLAPIAVVTSSTVSPFTWGPYQSMMMVLPAVIAPFYVLFGGVHFYQICGVVISALEIVILFRLARHVYGRTEAVVACVVLALLPAHLGFARTETTMIFTSFWTTLLLALATRYDQRPDRSSLVAFGLLAGVASNFHASLRTVVFLAAGWLVVSECLRRGRKGASPWTAATAVARTVAIWIGAAIVGLGPSLLALDRAFFDGGGGGRIAWDHNLVAIAQTYLRTVLGYFVLPLSGHLPFSWPLLTPMLGVPLVCGAAVALTRSGPTLSRLVVGLLVVIPLTNSAITDWALSPSRLSPLYPAVALAIAAAPRLFPARRRLALAMIVIAVAGSVYQAGAFFLRVPAPMARIEPAGMTHEMAYALAHAIHAARSREELRGAPTLCWGVSPAQYAVLQLPHLKENLSFYLPHVQHEVRVVPGLADTTVDLSRTCPADRAATTWTAIVDCADRSAYRCGGVGPITLNIGR